MKTTRQQTRKSNSISYGRWAAYTAAAAASTFAAATSAEAAIHYSGLINQKLAQHDHASFPLGSDGGMLVFRHFPVAYGSSSDRFGAAYLSVDAPSGAVQGMFTHNNHEVSASKLKQRDLISAGSFPGYFGILAGESFFNAPAGQFRDPGYGLVGFKFNNGSGDQYGWARIKMFGYPKFRFTVVDYAYGDPGDRVLAGQKSDGSGPDLESLGGLALGAAGLVAWRRRRASL